MKLFKICLIYMAILSGITSCVKNEDVLDRDTITIDLTLIKENDWKMANEILLLINKHRANVGLEPLKKDEHYASALSVGHTKYMIDKGQINHDNFSFRSQSLKLMGAIVVGENVAFGYDTAETVVTAWLHSESHKKIIEGNYTHSGFGIIKSIHGIYYYTLLFYRN